MVMSVLAGRDVPGAGDKIAVQDEIARIEAKAREDVAREVARRMQAEALAASAAQTIVERDQQITQLRADIGQANAARDAATAEAVTAKASEQAALNRAAAQESASRVAGDSLTAASAARADAESRADAEKRRADQLQSDVARLGAELTTLRAAKGRAPAAAPAAPAQPIKAAKPVSYRAVVVARDEMEGIKEVRITPV